MKYRPTRIFEGSQKGAAWVEFALFLGLSIIIATSFGIYFRRYLESTAGDEVAQRLNIARLVGIPNAVMRDEKGDIILAPDYSEQVKAFILGSFVSKESISNNSTDCKKNGDYMSFSIEYKPPFPKDPTTGLPNATNRGTLISQVYDCAGSVQTIGAAELQSLTKRVDKKAEQGVGRQTVYMVIWSHLFPNLPPIIRTVHVASNAGPKASPSGYP